MPLFVCENCGCIENTALGHYWARNHVGFKDEKMNNKALCSECTPSEYSNGVKTERGKWHGQFPKEKFDPSIHDNSNYLNAKKS
jgi:hypothetical protein